MSLYFKSLLLISFVLKFVLWDSSKLLLLLVVIINDVTTIIKKIKNIVVGDHSLIAFAKLLSFKILIFGSGEEERGGGRET